MIEHVEKSVEAICSRFSSENNVEVSAHARLLLTTILEGITVDPHPRWKLISEDAGRIVETYLSALPLFLYQIAKEEKVRGAITTFDVLHWLPNHIVVNCIIDKKDTE